MTVSAGALRLLAVAALGSFAAAGAQDISKADVEMSLISELVSLVGKDGPGELEVALQPFFEASPKDASGALQRQAAREALDRFFVQRRGWSVHGLAEPSSDELAKGWVPAYLLDLVEQRLEGRGAGLRELSALAAAFEGLARQEAEARMVRTYEALSLPMADGLTEEDATAAVRAYLAGYARSSSPEELPEHAQELLRRIGKSISELSDKGTLDLLAMKRIAVAIGEQYAHFHSRQCSADAQLPCLEASGLYALCCHEESSQAFEDSALVTVVPIALGVLALFAASMRRMLTAGPTADAEAEDDPKKPAPTVSHSRPAWLGMALSVAIAVAFALQLLDVTVLAGALLAGLLMLTSVRVVPPQAAGAKVKES